MKRGKFYMRHSVNVNASRIITLDMRYSGYHSCFIPESYAFESRPETGHPT